MARILVVDDYPVAVKLLAYTLRTDGHDVLPASSGQDALDVLARETVELAIFDLVMPEMDGVTLLRRVRSDPRWADLPVIMLTGSAQDDDREVAREAGANDFLTKPASSREVLETVRRLLGA